MIRARGARITITLDASTLLHLDADARRRRRSRSRAAAEHIREAVRAVMLAPEDLPRAEVEQAAAIQALRRRLARTILGGTIGWNLAAWEATRAAERGEGVPSGGSGPPARHWGCNGRRGHSGANGAAASCPEQGAGSPNATRLTYVKRAG